MADTERLRTVEGEPLLDTLRLFVHDLRNPMTAIRILAELCRDTADPEMRRDLGDILEAADLAGALLEGLDAMIRLQRRPEELTWFPLDLVEVLSMVIDRPALRRHVEIAVPNGVHIVGDRQALTRAFTDVLVNARRLADRGSVVVTVEDGAVVTIRVRHPAPGIPAGVRDQLFEPFGAVEIRNQTIPVTAVGLAHATQMLAAHQGTMSFEDLPDGGLDLLIRLPR